MISSALAGPRLSPLLLFITITVLFQTTVAWGAQCSTNECHARLTAPRQLHSPEITTECTLCHKQKTEGHPSGGGADFALMEEGSQLCFQCHEPFDSRPNTHMPVEGGECSLCHPPHGDTEESVTAANDNLTDLCTTCHDSFDQPHLHGPVAVGACTACHNPHASSHDALLKKESRDLCMSCHADFAEGMKSSSVIHTPVAEQSCTACHDPHQSQHPNLLSGKMPDICFGCHETMKEKYLHSKTRHPVLSQGNSCGNCHSTHFSQSSGLLGQKQKDLCLNCHGQNNHKKSTGLKNIASETVSKNFLHGPLEQGACSACHDPHGSDHFRMLRARYPEDFYAPYQEDTYALCLSCHDQYMLRYPDTTIYTQFRNGKLNLHYVHVTKSRKGRTCRACHEPHASNQYSLISVEGPSFGEWNIPTRFRQTDTGGSCTPGCHRQVAYDREDPVNYGPK